MADVFISYSRADSKRCDAVRETLSREGYTVAVDHQFIGIGESYRARIEQEIEAATAVIVLWSAASRESNFVLDEVDLAKRRQQVLLPLILDDTPDGEVLGYGQLQSLRCQWIGNTLAPESRERLLADVKRHVRPVGPPGAAVLEVALKQLREEVDCKLGDEYTVEERLGTGRMAVVFKARHNVLGRTVAIKVAPLAGILLLPGFYAEFRGTLEAAKTLSHPNILRIHDVKLLDTIACVVVDYIQGESLAQRIAQAGARMPLGLIKDIACEIADALTYSHSNGILHHRLSPSNVLIASSDDRAFLSDFGMPNVGGSPEATAVQALFLDARYMSPELCLGEAASRQSDQYAFGAMLYEMLTGRPPFVGNAAFSIMKQQCEAAPRPIAEFRPDCPRAVEGSVLRMLSKEPGKRFLATGELAREVREWPLPEPDRSRDRISATGADVRAAKTALASFERCLSADTSLLFHFYERVKQDPTLAPHLERMNVDRQIKMLRKAIRHLFEYALGDERAQCELERVAAMHRDMGLQESQLRRFVETLIGLALDRDPHAAEIAERALLERDWRASMEIGLRRFVELALVAPKVA